MVPAHWSLQCHNSLREKKGRRARFDADLCGVSEKWRRTGVKYLRYSPCRHWSKSCSRCRCRIRRCWPYTCTYHPGYRSHRCRRRARRCSPAWWWWWECSGRWIERQRRCYSQRQHSSGRSCPRAWLGFPTGNHPQQGHRRGSDSIEPMLTCPARYSNSSRLGM